MVIPGMRHETGVMVHGWTSSRREPMSKAGYLLDAGYNVLVFDLRGHGSPTETTPRSA
jgi:pimeloyl-ACP methyl ester carboxylesterase